MYWNINYVNSKFYISFKIDSDLIFLMVCANFKSFGILFKKILSFLFLDDNFKKQFILSTISSQLPIFKGITWKDWSTFNTKNCDVRKERQYNRHILHYAQNLKYLYTYNIHVFYILIVNTLKGHKANYI